MKYAMRERDSDAQVAAIIENIACRAHAHVLHNFSIRQLCLCASFTTNRTKWMTADRRTPPIDYYILPSLIAVREGFVGVAEFCVIMAGAIDDRHSAAGGVILDMSISSDFTSPQSLFRGLIIPTGAIVLTSKVAISGRLN